jgi:CubicO group peptidase (beta-lactamase class C family)
MRRLKKVFLGAVILLSGLGGLLYVLAPHAPPTPRTVKNRAELEAYFDRLVESSDPPGLSAVVVKNGRIAYNRAFGLANGPRSIAAVPDTVYHWWSLTKIPTAISVLQLQEKGLLTIGDRVVKYLPWFSVSYPSADSPRITIGNLLQHSSGLPDTMPGMIGWVHTDDNGRNQTTLVKRVLPKYQKLRFKPGEKAVYSNLNYMVLGAIIEAVTEQSYENYVSEHILQPLGMSRTSFVYTPLISEYEALGTLPVVHTYTPLVPFLLDFRALIRERKGKLFWIKRIYIDATPSSGLIGSAPDVARLLLTYLKGGRPIMKPKSVSLMTNTAPLDGIGLGWFVSPNPDIFYLEHNGGGPGFATAMRIYPKKDLGIAVLANGTDLDRAGLLDLLASTF